MICSKVMPGAQRVFRLEAVLEASVDELYNLLFVKVEEMHLWNPDVQEIKVSNSQEAADGCRWLPLSYVKLFFTLWWCGCLHLSAHSRYSFMSYQIIAGRGTLSHYAFDSQAEFPVGMFVAGPEACWTWNYRHSWGFSPNSRKSDWPKGLPECQTQLQARVRCLSWRGNDSVGLLPTSGRLREVQHAAAIDALTAVLGIIPST